MGQFAVRERHLQSEWDLAQTSVRNYFSARKAEISEIRALRSWRECFGGIWLVCVGIYSNLLMISAAVLHLQPEAKLLANLVFAGFMLFSFVCAIASRLANRSAPYDSDEHLCCLRVLKHHLKYIEEIDLQKISSAEELEELNSYMSRWNFLLQLDSQFINEQAKAIDEFAASPVEGLLDQKEKK